ncbi:MAG: glycosyltransferase family 2 protein, partial [Ignavibacteria bacterium]|nr:glycosyltransferase family 2 protein [Ignavibacteria bacterium]
FRAYSAEVLKKINYSENSHDFIFDNEILSQIISKGYEIAEITCPTKYFAEASSINLKRSFIYGLGVLKTSIVFRLHKWGMINSNLYN